MQSCRGNVSKGEFDRVLLRSLDSTWRTAGQVHRLLGYGQALEVARGLERLWKAGLAERDERDIGVGCRRKGGGDNLRLQTYRQKSRRAPDEPFDNQPQRHKDISVLHSD
jgi:hypothetical protein